MSGAGTVQGQPLARIDASAWSVETTSVNETVIRTLDLIGAAALLVLLSPLFVLIALVVKFDSPGPVIFRQRRLGRCLQPFTVAKFRTMREGVDANPHRAHVEEMISNSQRDCSQPMSKLEEDDRVTRVGSLLRRSSLDELPQLWNVLVGQMSLVGPRPPIQYEVDHYPEEAFRRFAVKPGITGLWQVRGRSLLSFQEMIALDAEYVERRSLLLNLRILLLTLPTVLHGKGAA
jgi:lipopolysaccharide/colanic/teichoic acid biosynthesis glycosyltransferase